MRLGVKNSQYPIKYALKKVKIIIGSTAIML